MKKVNSIFTLMLVMVMLVNLVGCKKDTKVPPVSDVNQNETPVSDSETSADAATRQFTDSTGRTVNIPAEIKGIAVSGPLAQIVFYSFAPELLVGWSSKWSVDAEGYIPEKYLQLPVLGQLYGGKGELNLEELLAASPDVVVDIGESKGSVREDMDSLSEQTGIPFVHIEAATRNMGDAYRKIGELTGLTDRAEEYAKYCEDIYGKIADIMNKVGADNKVRALYCLGDAGCNVIAKGSYQAEIIDLITDNIAAVDNPSAKGTGNEVDMEQILNWNPDFIIFAPDSIYDTVSDDPTWQEISAIKNGNYAEVPFGPYNWLGFPPSVQRYLGMMWLTTVLYPDECDFDLKTEVKKYYQMFYHIELTDAQYDALTADSFVK